MMNKAPMMLVQTIRQFKKWRKPVIHSGEMEDETSDMEGMEEEDSDKGGKEYEEESRQELE